MQSSLLPSQLIELVKKLNGDQLHELQRLVLERLHIYHQAQTLTALREFQILDRVTFEYQGRSHTGTVNRINRKSVSVLTDDRIQWTISPSMLRKIQDNKGLKHIIAEIMKG